MLKYFKDLFTLFILVQLFFSVIIFFSIRLYSAQEDLQRKINLVRTDLTFTNNSWDLTRYNRDPQLIGSYPLYLISTEGFVLDRRSPVRGFLDTSILKNLLEYQKVQTIRTISNQSRRIYSVPIKNNDSTVGVIAVSFFNPTQEHINEIDSKLKKTSEFLASKILVKNDFIDTNKIDEREIPYDISYIIVDKFNTVLTRSTNVNNHNRIPNYIDTSYLKPFLTQNKVFLTKDSATNELYILKSETIKDKQNTTIAFIIIGQSLRSFIKLLIIYIVIQSLISIALLIVYKLFIQNKKENKNVKKSHAQIIFDEAKGKLLIDNNEIVIPYATNQFILLKAVINKPTKRWENDELLLQFGEENTPKNWRKVYDAMNSINKKAALYTPHKIIVIENKTYRLNPQLEQFTIKRK